VKVVAGEDFGQIFITDTNREHLDAIIKKMNADYRIFTVNSGKIEPVT
jgi:DNA replication and repair protein RecF